MLINVNKGILNNLYKKSFWRDNMDFFKIYLVKSPKVDRISSDLIKLCSKIPKIITFDNKAYSAVNYNPDDYFSNLNNISKFFSKGEVVPLLMTNFKFLYLLKESQNYDLRINKFELSEGEDEEFEDMIFQQSEDLEELKKYLSQTHQKIKYMTFIYVDNRNFIKISQTGVISITEEFGTEQEKKIILDKVIGLLVEGRVN